jgi:sialic acid synthase SpsE
LRTGLSDHSKGISVPTAAVALGAQVIEKHFTLDRGLPGPDHQASLEPGELKDMVRSIREVELALGQPVKTPAPSELKNIAIARKSLIAACDIAKGELFSSQNLTVKRPGNGISPLEYWDWLGQAAPHDFKEDEVIKR